jgi:hypothetical protein
MRKNLVLKALKYQDFGFTLIYFLWSVSYKLSAIHLLVSLVFNLSLKYYLHRRYLRFQRRVYFIVVNLGFLCLLACRLDVYTLMGTFMIGVVGLVYQYHSKAYLDLLSWVSQHVLIESGQLTRHSLTLGAEVYDDANLFPLTPTEFKQAYKHLKALDSKLRIEVIRFRDSHVEVYQIHH